MEYHSNNNTNRDGSAAVNAASGSNNRKPATAQQLIRENVKYLIEQLEAGHSETLTAYLNAMANFHTYSFGNVLLIARQRPQATHVAGIRTWNELGRRVKRGEKGIAILAPMIGKRRKKENTEAATEEEANTIHVARLPPRFCVGRIANGRRIAALNRRGQRFICSIDGDFVCVLPDKQLGNAKQAVEAVISFA